MVTKKLILKKEVNLEDGAKAIYLSKGATEYDWETIRDPALGIPGLYEIHMREAKACADAWGLRYE